MGWGEEQVEVEFKFRGQWALCIRGPRKTRIESTQSVVSLFDSETYITSGRAGTDRWQEEKPVLGLAGLESGLGSVRDSHRHPPGWGWWEAGGEQSGMVVLGAQGDLEGDQPSLAWPGRGRALDGAWAERRPGGLRERGSGSPTVSSATHSSTRSCCLPPPTASTGPGVLLEE